MKDEAKLAAIAGHVQQARKGHIEYHHALRRIEQVLHSVPARLDEEGTAKPLTEIVGVYPAGKKNFYSNAEALLHRDIKPDTGDERVVDALVARRTAAGTPMRRLREEQVTAEAREKKPSTTELRAWLHQIADHGGEPYGQAARDLLTMFLDEKP